MDRFWSLSPRAVEYKRLNKEEDVSSGSDAMERAEESRADQHRPSHSYSFISMLAYLFYIPLYIAGPITSFNSFSSCIERRQQSHDMPKLMRMLARVFAMGIALEVSVHFLYYTAISEAGTDLPTYFILLPQHASLQRSPSFISLVDLVDQAQLLSATCLRA